MPTAANAPDFATYELVTIHCDHCDDSTQHALVELVGGPVVLVCSDCLTQTVLHQEPSHA